MSTAAAARRPPTVAGGQRARGRLFDRRPALSEPVVAIAAFFLMAIVLGALGQSRLLMLAYPAGAVALGAVLVFRRPDGFMSFLLWLLFLSPFIRRLDDYSGGWNAFSLISLAPYLVGVLAAPTALRRLLWPSRPLHLAALLVCFALTYGFIVGCFRNGLSPAAYGLAGWLLPVCIALYVDANARWYPALRHSLTVTAAAGAVVMGCYAVLQYVAIPAWDAYWMEAAGMTSIGNPLPFEVRPFSTMNSPGPFAMMIAALLLILAPLRGWKVWPAKIAAAAGLLLSLVRAAWFGLAVGLLFAALSLRGRDRFAPLLRLSLAVCLLAPLLYVSGIADPVLQRMDTLLQLDQDASFNDRHHFYETFSSTALTQVIGRGLGEVGLAAKLNDTDSNSEYLDFDSGLMAIPFAFGWIGGVLLIAGLSWALVVGVTDALRSGDSFTLSLAGAAISIAAQLIFSSVIEGPVGFVFWISLGLVSADQQYRERIRSKTAQARLADNGVPAGVIRLHPRIATAARGSAAATKRLQQ